MERGKHIALAASVFVALALRGGVVDLSGEWRLDYWPQPDSGAVRTLPIPGDLPHQTVTAQVPGNCELDLVAAGVLPTPEVGLNVLKFHPYEGYQWLYSKTFVWSEKRMSAGGKSYLEFEGIDTLADVFLNGRKIAETENMLIPHRFDVTRQLRNGENTVQVLIRSIMLEAQEYSGNVRSGLFGSTDNDFFRKAGFMAGWDIFPRLYVAGLWRPVRVVTEAPVVVDELAWVLRRWGKDRRIADFDVHFRVRGPARTFFSGNRMRASLSLRGKKVASEEWPLRVSHNVRNLRLDGARLWWPKGMGEQPLYDAAVEIVDTNSEVIAKDVCRIGVRTVELLRSDVYDKERPGQFLFKINGEPVYVRGVNWVPTDAFPARGRTRLRETLELVDDLNCNMIRVWGGGLYEPDEFFDYCDEHGILVWQDFMTACGSFPQDDRYARLTADEVKSVVLRLRNRASLALWAGNNENDFFANMRTPSTYLPDPNDDRNSRRTIPAVLAEHDVSRPYLPSSPYCSADVVAGRAKPSEDHLWGERGYYKTDYYTNNTCWFVSEMGYHGCPERKTIERMMTADCVYPWRRITGDNPMKDYDWNLEWRFKASNPLLENWQWFLWTRNSLMTRQVKIMFGEVPRDLDKFIEESQLVQAEAMKTFCELFRSRKFKRSNGLIWWNVRDGWPQISDAVVDYYGAKKLAYWALRNSQRDQIVVVRDDRRAIAVNDSPAEVKGAVRIYDASTGRVALERAAFVIPANDTADLGDVQWNGRGVLIIDATLGGRPFVNHFLYGEVPFEYSSIRSLIPFEREK